MSELGHPQPPTPIHVDNTTAVGIVNNTIKRQRSWSMEMRYFWLLDQEDQKYMNVQHHPGQENLGDYPSKHHIGMGHQHVRPYYIHMPNSPTHLPRAGMPSSRQGSAKILGDPYVKMVLLPRIPNYHDLGQIKTPLSVCNSNIAQQTQARNSLDLLNRQEELMTSQYIRLRILLAQ